MKVSLEFGVSEASELARLLGVTASVTRGVSPDPVVTPPTDPPPVPPVVTPPFTPAAGFYVNTTEVVVENGVTTTTPGMMKLPEAGGPLGYSPTDRTLYSVP